MLSSLQALLDIGKCRELPIVGFVRGYMVVGVIVSIPCAVGKMHRLLNGGVNRTSLCWRSCRQLKTLLEIHWNGNLSDY